MTMHLVGPWLSKTGKSMVKKKYRNAEEARRARELESSWTDLKSKWGVSSTPKKSVSKSTGVYVPTPVVTRSTRHIPSLNGGVDTLPATKAAQKVYTGTKIKGIATMHKSNAVPVFSNEEAIDIAKMRR